MSDKQMDRNSPVCCVGLGASAGGLEALDQFFDAMPAQSGLAFVVVQHLSPDYKSLMAELLSKHTQMEVVRAEDGMAIASNHVYIIPPRKDIRLFRGKLQLSDQVRDERGINLPIDVFFQSLAQDLKDRSVGIVLSGTGSDGARGIRAIKEVGGLTVAQSAETARFDGMPRAAVATGLVDFVLPVAEMPGKLMSFVDHPYLAAQTPRSPLLLEEDRLARVFAMLREQARVDFTLYKQSTIARRIERRMTVNQIVELSEYVSFMENRPSEVMSLYRELLIGVTSFFRDPDVWEALLTKHLTKLLSESESDEVRMWVAGCSTGEEAYTLAMVCHEVMNQLDRQFDIKIFATDIDRDAIGRASTGVYPEAVIGDMTPQRVTRFFNRQTEQVKVVRAIREMVVFAHHNLITDPPFTNLDLVCCRNLLIYLQPVLQQKIIDGFNFSLHTDALLVLGSSETTGDMSENFDCLDSKLKIFRSRGQARRGRRGFAMPLAADRLGLSGKGVLGRRGYQPGRQDDKLMERLLDTLAQGMIPLSMVVNEQNELLHVVGETAGILTLPSGKVHNDITRMVVGELGVPLATGLRRIFDTGQEVKYKNIRMERGGEDVAIDLTVRRIAGRHNQENLALISVEEQGAIPQPRDGVPGAEFDVASANDQRIRDLEQELQFSKENLQATIEELESSNEELQATNEELLASNEELQSTNEELQSVNEELHTVNAQHQEKIMELTELHNDFDNLLNTLQFFTMFLDVNLHVRKFTPDLKKVFNLTDGDIGRPFTHLEHNLVDADLLDLIIEVERTGLIKEKEVRTHDGDWFHMRAIPYRVAGESAMGVVLTLFDTTSLKKTQKDLAHTETRLNYLFKELAQGIVYQDLKGRIMDANPAAQKILGVSLDQMTGRTSMHPDWRTIRSDGSDYPGQDHPIMRAQASREPVENEIMGVFHPGKEDFVWIQVSAYPLLEENTGALLGAFSQFKVIGEGSTCPAVHGGLD